MSNYRKQMIDINDAYQAKRWEGKPLKFKLKYLVANYPGVAICCLAMMIAPFGAYYKYYTYPGSKREAIRKYKPNYTVVRDDDPNIETIKRQKELGREFFPQY